MNIEQAYDTSRWYVIHTRPKQERRADENLRAWGVETFTPLISVLGKQGKHDPAGVRTLPRRRPRVPAPLFPRYIFANFDYKNLFHKVRFTRGVHKVVSFGEGPTPVNEDIINIIRSRVGEDGFVRLGDDLSLGDTVGIMSGPFKNFMGVFERRLQDSERVAVLLSTVNFQARLLIEEEWLRKIA